MAIIMGLAAVVAGVIHVYIFCMESLWWTTPAVRARFRQTPEQAETTRLLAFNQGFYNLFLAGGVFGGLALFFLGHERPGMVLIGWSCLCMAAAAVVLAVSAPGMRRGAVIQGAAPFIYLVLLAGHLAH